MRPLVLLLFVVPAILHAYPQQSDRRVSSSIKYTTVLAKLPFPVAARSKALACGRLPAEIVGTNPTGGMDFCLFSVLCVVR